MYYLDEIMDRAFNNWTDILGANDSTFWSATSTIESKPEVEKETPSVPSTPSENPPWEPADTTETPEQSADIAANSNTFGEAIETITETTKEVIDELNPFTDH
jgi:hypothetical protein